MALTPAEKQQIEAAVDAFIESPNVQTVVTNIITGAETTAENAIDTIINNAKVGGLLGSIFTALKGSAEAEVNALIASLPPGRAHGARYAAGVEAELKTASLSRGSR